MRLLTGEERKEAGAHHSNPSSILQARLQDQDEKTLKAVGEWLEGDCLHSSDAWERRMCSICIDQLKQGKMPEPLPEAPG